MKLLCKKIKSHTCLPIFQSTNDANRRGRSVLLQSFRKPKNAEEERKLIENGIEKGDSATIVLVFKAGAFRY